ncbi:LptF/LptG family permease [Niastella sp. OAS944]|uniref:LptF/LptG family permease n=1 Tax=Niastella sp. OAS944 TaxID=2664089 RepID=UPI00347783D8|nr:lipopolysaccharide export system permease protein [Chitinophagaceae bacterium OAS944]
MIKKLDILVLRSFIGPFIATFFLTLFVLILQFFWLWIDDFVGKGMDTFTMLRLVLYLSATLVPLALPLAILLSSIMTFGNLGETFELVAIKSAGIGLLRFMLPLTVVAMLLSFLAFMFNNYVIPIANLRMKTLHYDIVNKKPAFDLKEGVFYTTIPDYAIKVSKKEKDSILHNVVIYENSTGPQDNIVIAEKGIMRVSNNQRFLEFILYNGWRYEEQGNRYSNDTKFIRLGFKEYKKVLDLSALAFNPTSDSAYKDRYEMLSNWQLSKNVDSLQKSLAKFTERDTRELQGYLTFSKYLDTGWVDVKAPPVKKGKSFLEQLPDSLKMSPTDITKASVKQNVLDQSISYANSLKSSIEGPSWDYEGKRKELRMTMMTYHEKITMSVAVLVLFLIGAPLGSIVRKGGIGTPVVFAVVFFVIFFLLNNFGKKFVKEDVLQPAAGMWLATAVLLPIAVFLIIKALNDSQLFNKEFYYRAFRAIRKLVKKEKVVPKEAPQVS